MLVRYNGQVRTVPDGMSPDEIAPLFEQDQGALPIAARMAQMLPGMQGQGQTVNTMPALENAAFLTPEQTLGTLQIQQRSQENDAQQMMEQRISRERQMEAEKDRAQQLKLQQQQFKNQQAQMKLEQSMREDELRQKGNEPIKGRPGDVLIDPNTGREILRIPETAQPVKPFPVSPGTTVFDPQTGKPIYQAPFAPQTESEKRYVVGNALVGPDGKPLYQAPEKPQAESMTRYQATQFGILDRSTGEVKPIPQGGVNPQDRAKMIMNAMGDILNSGAEFDTDKALATATQQIDSLLGGQSSQPAASQRLRYNPTTDEIE